MRTPGPRSILAAAICLAVSGATTAQPAPASPADAPRPDFGTTSLIQYHLGYTEFAPAVSTSPHFTQSVPLGYYTTDAGALFVASPHIPTGALLASIELDFCDTSLAGEHISLYLADCAFNGSDCHALYSYMTSSVGCGFHSDDLTALGYTMLNNVRELLVEVELDSGDATNVLNGVYIAYKLQVSPAPGVATFGDVPITSPIFKFVEALHAAGITSGCGGGNFCPNQPLTRGQMAVFLASALGLHYPE